MFIIGLALITSTSTAADLDADGCEDSYFDINAACVAPSAVVGSGVSLDASASVGAYATLGDDIALGADSLVAERAVLVGRVSSLGFRPVGARTTIGRRAHIGADQDIGVDNTLGRAVDAGERLQTQANVTVGYAARLGDDVTLGTNAILGNLVDVGDNTSVVANAVLARGVQIADSLDGAQIGGVMGPEVSIGRDATIATTVRIRKNATLGNDVTVLDGARIGRDVQIDDNVTIGANVRIGAGAQVTATTIVPDGTVIARGEIYDDPSIGEFVGGTLLSPEEMAQINAWIGTPAQDWELCYAQASHSSGATPFHDRCDGYAGTVTVVTNGAVKFGGYTPLTWDDTTPGYVSEPSQSSFLFSLTNNHRHSMIRGGNDIQNDPSKGPAFGSGNDMGIFRYTYRSYCYLGASYACRVGQPGSRVCSDDLCGPTDQSYLFYTSAVEVYRRRN